MKKLAAAFSAFLALCTILPAHAEGDGNRIRHERRDMQRDRQDMRRAERHGNERAENRYRRDLNRDRQHMRRDMRDRNRDARNPEMRDR